MCSARCLDPSIASGHRVRVAIEDAILSIPGALDYHKIGVSSAAL